MNLSPSLSYVLACPKRYHLEKVQKQKTPAPFASATLGNLVHKRIAYSLRTGNKASLDPFDLPRRLLLQEYEDLSDLCQRAEDSLSYFNDKVLSYLAQFKLHSVEYRLTTSLKLDQDTYNLSGVIDCMIQTPKGLHILDWKTSSVKSSDAQLKFYLVLAYLEWRERELSAEAVSLSTGESQMLTFSPELKDWFKDYLRDMVSALAECERKMPKPGSHCKYCPFAHACELSEAPERVLLDMWTGEVSYLG
ncbi:MAG: PD-(D/E)XK nuclease family protein [Trueperaceae bacterium]|nr:PD-(D/E)XK nuclease family protein [Trueperaceae bacterium]